MSILKPVDDFGGDWGDSTAPVRPIPPDYQIGDTVSRVINTAYGEREVFARISGFDRTEGTLMVQFDGDHMRPHAWDMLKRLAPLDPGCRVAIVGRYRSTHHLSGFVGRVIRRDMAGNYVVALDGILDPEEFAREDLTPTT
jgi:hypothetical protein